MLAYVRELPTSKCNKFRKKRYGQWLELRMLWRLTNAESAS